MATTGSEEEGRDPIDVSLLSGFVFACRPDCGLCCFTSPRLDVGDSERLRVVAPEARIVGRGGERCIAARPDGGACQFLSQLRCRVHPARPAPCREFPVSVHVGLRCQATVVLSCPGVSTDALVSRESAAGVAPFAGFDVELRSARSRARRQLPRLRGEVERRRRRIVHELEVDGRWMDDAEVRDLLRKAALIPTAEEYRPSEPPDSEEGLDRLPMYFDGRRAPAALARGLGGWEAFELGPDGGAKRIGEAVPPDEVPSLTPGAERLLSSYLRYWLDRDCFLAAVHLEMRSTREGNVADVALEELHSIASDVLARGAFRSRLRGEAGARLSAPELELGIRATDQDWLDRPTWGSRL